MRSSMASRPSAWERFLRCLPGLTRPSKPMPPSLSAVDRGGGGEASFEEHMESGRLIQAAEQLIAREERLFGGGEEEEGGGEVQRALLAADRTIFTGHLRQALSRSFNSDSAEDVAVLRSAVDAIRKDEEQDRRWQGTGTGRSPPPWRPGGLRALHDAALRDLVGERMNGASTPGDTPGQSSIQRDVLAVGRQLKADLGWVVRVVKGCYPAEMDICNLYARLYHRAFSATLSEIAQFGLDDNDCTVVLRWVNGYYPDILRDELLRGDVDSARLGPLLPRDLCCPLEAQFLSTSKEKVGRRMLLCLKEEEDLWRGGAPPTPTDGCYLSPLAIDVLQCLNGAVLETECTLGDQRKTQVVACVLGDFLDSLQSFLSSVMLSAQTGSGRRVLLAHLPVLAQLRDYVVHKAHLFPEEVKGRCLHTLSSVTDSAHTCLLGPVQKALKPHIRSVGTSSWLKRLWIEGLLHHLELHIQDLQGPGNPSREELLARLQLEVTVEYVTRLLKGNLKLGLKQQEQAAEAVTEDAEQLSQVFSGAGSGGQWLVGIMSQIAEVLRLQHLPTIQIVVAVLGVTYPDLSPKHVSSLLKLKSTLSRADRAMVQDALDDCRKDPPPPPTPPLSASSPGCC